MHLTYQKGDEEWSGAGPKRNVIYPISFLRDTMRQPHGNASLHPTLARFSSKFFIFILGGLHI